MSETQTSIENGTNLPGMKPRSKKPLWFGLVLVTVLIGAIFTAAYHSLATKRVAMEEDVFQRQKNIAGSRTETANAWLESLVEQAARLVGSDLFQLFASEVDKLPDGTPFMFDSPGTGTGGAAEQLSSQLPLMRTMLTEFISYTGFSSARIVNSRAVPYMGTEATDRPLTTDQIARVKQVIATGERQYSPIAVVNKWLGFEMYMPILPPQFEQQSKKAVAVIIFTRLADSKMNEFISPGVSVEQGRTIKLVQRANDVFQEVIPSDISVHPINNFNLNSQGDLPFTLRPSFSGKGEAYSLGYPVRATGWWIVVENDAAVVNASLTDEAQKLYGMAGLFSLTLALLVVAAWWRLVGHEQSTINEQFRELLVVIDDQKKLLDGINNTISDPIALADGKGVYKYVNRAFASVVGREENDVVGLDGPAVFGFDTAKRLNSSDQHVLMTGESITVNEVLWLQSRRYHFQISKTPLRDAVSRTPYGIVSVYRDITKLVETEERGRRVVQQTIDALVRTIEEADPFLGGHSRIMGGIAGLLGRQLRLTDPDIATIEAAANLSQIGKMFVPRDILLKPGALTPEEKIEMERHIEHAKNILQDIEFDLPVVATIAQMNERLDGKGYPDGLTAEAISIHARVLAVANSFAAMARPRSYRPALPVDQVLGILERQTDSYDQDVVAALRQVLTTPAGERIIQQAAAAKAI